MSACPTLMARSALAVDGDGVALEWFRDDGVVERVAAESLGPLDPGGLVAGCDVGGDRGKRDRAGLRELVEEAFEPEVVVGVGVGDVDRGQRPGGRRDASCQLGDVALCVLGVDEDRLGGAEHERRGGRRELAAVGQVAHRAGVDVELQVGHETACVSGAVSKSRTAVSVVMGSSLSRGRRWLLPR